MKIVKCLIIFLTVMMLGGFAMQTMNLTYPDNLPVTLLSLAISAWWIRKIWQADK